MRNLTLSQDATFTASEWSKLRLGLDKDGVQSASMSKLMFATIVTAILMGGAALGALAAFL